MRATELVTLGLLFLPLLFPASCSSAPERQRLESNATQAYLKLLKAERAPKVKVVPFIHKLRAFASEYPGTLAAKEAIKFADTLEAEMQKREKARLKKHQGNQDKSEDDAF